MKEDLSRIIAALITDVPSGKAITEDTCAGLNVLKEKWPGLTQTEKEEIAAIILALKTIENPQTKEL